MKVDKWVEFETEVAVEISADDCVAAILEGGDDLTVQHVKYLCSRFLTTLKKLPDAAIALQSPEARAILHREFLALAARWRSEPAPVVVEGPDAAT